MLPVQYHKQVFRIFIFLLTTQVKLKKILPGKWVKDCAHPGNGWRFIGTLGSRWRSMDTPGSGWLFMGTPGRGWRIPASGSWRRRKGTPGSGWRFPAPGSRWRRKGTPEVGEGSFRAQKRAKEIVTISEVDKVLGSDIEGIDDWEKLEKKILVMFVHGTGFVAI